MHIKTSVLNSKAASTPKLVYEEFAGLAKTDQESFWILALDTKNKILAKEMISLGGIDSASVDLKILFKRLLTTGASGFVCAHNHPSGEPAPSEDDKILTKTIGEAARLLDIKFLDHVIVGDDSYHSFKEAGAM